MIPLAGLDYPDYAPSNGDYDFLPFPMTDSILTYIVIIILIFIIFAFIKKRRELTSHWNVLIRGLSYSTQDYYTKLETVLNDQGIDGITFKRESMSTGGMFSQSREYFVISWKDFIYEVCASPYGKSFFVSYWAQMEPNRVQRALISIPVIGRFLLKTFAPLTYYKIDTSQMFNSLVHTAILETVDAISEEHKLERIPDHQRMQNTKDIFKR